MGQTPVRADAFARWLAAERRSIPPAAAGLLGLTLLVTSAGFYRLVYFISLGYAFSVVALAKATALRFWPNRTPAAALQGALLAAWGLRLGGYLLRRQLEPSYREQLAAVDARNAAVPLPRRALIWGGVSLLYLLMFAPNLFAWVTPRRRQRYGTGLRAVRAAGLGTMAAGLALEAVADRQKADFKRRHPRRYCDVGLYTVVRCPNYLGEITFWLGSWLAGLPLYTSLARALSALAGLVCIVLIMLGSTKRLERGQDERYGALPAYREYAAGVPVLIPFVPLYSLQGVRVYLE